MKSVRELILKRGQAKIDKGRVALTDNTFTGQHMGKDQFIVCIFHQSEVTSLDTFCMCMSNLAKKMLHHAQIMQKI